jgi:hypothetical protein
MIETQNTENFKKKLKELFKDSTNDNTQNKLYSEQQEHQKEQNPKIKSKDEILKRFKDFL